MSATNELGFRPIAARVRAAKRDVDTHNISREKTYSIDIYLKTIQSIHGTTSQFIRELQCVTRRTAHDLHKKTNRRRFSRFVVRKHEIHGSRVRETKAISIPLCYFLRVLGVQVCRERIWKRGPNELLQVMIRISTRMTSNIEVAHDVQSLTHQDTPFNSFSNNSVAELYRITQRLPIFTV